MRVARFTSTQQQSDLHQHSTLISNVHLSFSNQPSYFHPQPTSSMSSLASPSSLDHQPQIYCPSQDMTILSPQHMTIPTNTVYHSQLSNSFIQTQHEHQIYRFFLSLSRTPHITLTMDLSVLHKIPISLSFRHQIPKFHTPKRPPGLPSYSKLGAP